MRALASAIGRWRRNNPRREAEEVPAESRGLSWEQILDRIYALPDSEHEAGWQRLTHADLAGMDGAQLSDERARVRLRLMLDDVPESWLVECLQAIEAVRAESR